MKIDEAISELKYARAMFEFNPTTGDVRFRNDEDRRQAEAIDMAIRSLEAWKNVERMIKQQERNVSPKILENQVFVMSYGVIKGIYEGVKDE